MAQLSVTDGKNILQPGWTFRPPALLAILCVLFMLRGGECRAEAPDKAETPVTERQAEDPTPLAGKPYQTVFWGHDVKIPARNRDDVRALTLGVTGYAPHSGGDTVLPIAALYWRKEWDSWWTRNVIGLFVNELDLAKGYGRFQLLGHLENNTIPTADCNVKDGNEVKASSVIWGTASGWLGMGYRVPVAPWQTDNDLRLQLFYHAGYFYDKRTHDTGDSVRLPPNTFQHGLRVRARYDGLLRNIMELPHQGVAWGGDLELTRRDNWSDSTFGGLVFSRSDTRDYLKFSGYVIAASAIPGLSDRHRFIGYLHGGVSPMGKLDRFSAFRIGGGPFPNESDDLYRLPYPGGAGQQLRGDGLCGRYSGIPVATGVLHVPAPAGHLCLGRQPARL